MLKNKWLELLQGPKQEHSQTLLLELTKEPSYLNLAKFFLSKVSPTTSSKARASLLDLKPCLISHQALPDLIWPELPKDKKRHVMASMKAIN